MTDVAARPRPEVRQRLFRRRERGQAGILLLTAMEILPFDEAAGLEAARVRRNLEQAGDPIGTADCLIAGVCLSRSASLLTRNRVHFERVQGLALADDRAEPSSGPGKADSDPKT